MPECLAFIPRVRNRYGLKAGGRYCNHKALWPLVTHLCVLMVRRGLGTVTKEKRDRAEDISKGCEGGKEREKALDSLPELNVSDI